MTGKKSFSDIKPKTWEAFYDEWAHPVYGVLRAKGWKLPELDDLHQYIFMMIWQRKLIDRFDPQVGKFSTWMWSNISNLTKRYTAELVKKHVTRVHEVSTASAYEPEPFYDNDNMSNDGGLDQVHADLAIHEIENQIAAMPLDEFPSNRPQEHSQRWKGIMLQTFSLLINELETTGEINQSQLAQKEDLSPSLLNHRIKALAKLKAVQDWRDTIHGKT